MRVNAYSASGHIVPFANATHATFDVQTAAAAGTELGNLQKTIRSQAYLIKTCKTTKAQRSECLTIVLGLFLWVGAIKSLMAEKMGNRE